VGWGDDDFSQFNELVNRWLQRDGPSHRESCMSIIDTEWRRGGTVRVAMRVEGGDGRIGLNQSAMRWLPIVGLAGTTNSKTIFHTRVAGPNARCLGLLRARYSSRETEVGVIYHSGGGGRCGIQYLYRILMHIAATHSLSAVMRREWQTSM
jgi:hypothetical protein